MYQKQPCFGNKYLGSMIKLIFKYCIRKFIPMNIFQASKVLLILLSYSMLLSREIRLFKDNVAYNPLTNFCML